MPALSAPSRVSWFLYSRKGSTRIRQNTWIAKRESDPPCPHGDIPPSPGRDDMKIAQPLQGLGLRRAFSCVLPSRRDGVSQARGTHSVPTGNAVNEASCSLNSTR